jgi:hypothetical protein
LFGHKEKVLTPQSFQVEVPRKEEEKEFRLNELGLQVQDLLGTIESIDIFTELVSLSDSIKEQRWNSQEVLDLIGPWRPRLRAQIALLEALFAILPPDRQHGSTGCAKALSEWTIKKKQPN